MVDLKKDLDEYLLLQSDQKKNFKLSMPTVPLTKPNISGWFKRGQPQEDESWFQERKKECCPSLVSLLPKKLVPTCRFETITDRISAYSFNISSMKCPFSVDQIPKNCTLCHMYRNGDTVLFIIPDVSACFTI